MLKSLTYILLLVYLTVLYGQNLFDFDSVLRKDFYFIGMALFMFLNSFIIHRVLNTLATKYLLWYMLGGLFNEVFFSGGFEYLELWFMIPATIHLSFEKSIGKIIKKWKI